MQTYCTTSTARVPHVPSTSISITPALHSHVAQSRLQPLSSTSQPKADVCSSRRTSGQISLAMNTMAAGGRPESGAKQALLPSCASLTSARRTVDLIAMSACQSTGCSQLAHESTRPQHLKGGRGRQAGRKTQHDSCSTSTLLPVLKLGREHLRATGKRNQMHDFGSALLSTLSSQLVGPPARPCALRQ